MSATSFSSRSTTLYACFNSSARTRFWRRPAEQVAHPDELGKLLPIKGGGGGTHQDRHVEGRPAVVVGDGHQGPLSLQIAGGRVVGSHLQIVDDARLIAVEQLAEQPPWRSGRRCFSFQGLISSVHWLARVIR